MSDGINQRNAASLHEALQVERRRVDDLGSQLRGLAAAHALLRSEVETLRGIVLVQRTGTGPTVRGG